MKKLTYKIVKTVDVESQKAHFNREHYIKELRKEIGLENVPYEELTNYKVQLNSPTGRSSTFEVNALDYVDKELVQIEKYINEHNASLEESESFDFVTIMVDEKQEKMFRDTIEKSEDFMEWVDEPEIRPIEVPATHKVLAQEIGDKLRYFYVVAKDGQYVVVVADESHYQAVKNHFATKLEFKKGDQVEQSILNAVQINYYTWFNLVSDMEKPRKADDILSYEDIAKRMDNVMDQIQGIDLPKGFL